MILTDTHIHLYSEEFNGEQVQLVEVALSKGISRFFLPNVDSRTMAASVKLEEQYQGKCFAMPGLHPCSVKENYKQELAEVERWLNKQSFCAIGEIGIDLYWDQSTLNIQVEAFETQCKWAVERNLPIIIHCRNAFDETYEIIKKFDGKLKGIFHCFSGNTEQANKVIESGFFIGIGGVVTFKNSGLDKVVEQVDLKYIVLETDAPYLAPTPHRGKRNEPAYLYEVAQKVADLKQVSIEEVAQITTENSKVIFKM